MTEWLSSSEAAALLDMPVRELYRLIDAGEPPAYRFGRMIRLKVEDVERFRDGGDDGLTGVRVPR